MIGPESKLCHIWYWWPWWIRRAASDCKLIGNQAKRLPKDTLLRNTVSPKLLIEQRIIAYGKTWTLMTQCRSHSGCLDFQWKADLGIPLTNLLGGKESTCQAGRPWFWFLDRKVPGSGSRHDNYSSILAWRISLDREAWWCTVYGVARVGHYWGNLACMYAHKRNKW